MPYPIKGEQRNTGRTHFKKGQIPWNYKGGKPKCNNCWKQLTIYNSKTGLCVKCRNKKYPYWLGKKRSIKTIEKIRASKKGKHLKQLPYKRCEECGKKFRKTAIYSYRVWEKLRYCSRECYWKAKDTGYTSENKKLRMNKKWRDWRKAVFTKDNWTCQKYKIKSGRLHPHHIQNFAEFPELRFEIDNGITLSEKAHKEFHKIYGYKNNTKEQLEEFLC